MHKIPYNESNNKNKRTCSRNFKKKKLLLFQR